MSEHNVPQIPSLSGLLLVASPSLRDPNFRRTILLCSHHTAKDGAFGLVLNRPLGITIADMTNEPVDDVLGKVPLFYGGPVAAENPILAGLRVHSPHNAELRDFSHAKSAADIPEEWLPYLRVFVGHAGWAPGQLEGEIRENAWIIIMASEEIVNNPHPEQTWRMVLRRMAPIQKLLAEAPDDPTLN